MNSFFLSLSLICIGINISIMMFVTVVMPLQGKDSDIEDVPGLVPVMAFCSVILPIFMVIAIWPIWGFLSIIYIFIISLGYIFSLTFLPDGKIGLITFWLLMIGIATLSHTLPHAGHEHSW